MTILKRTLILIMCVILSLTMAFLLTSCEEEESPSESQHEHTYGEFVTTKEPTCTEAGERQKSCSCGDKVIEKIEARGHTEEAIAKVEPTCTETGLTEGKKCSVCGEILVAQTEISAKGHTEEAIARVEPTCTKPGQTAGKKCSVCGCALELVEVISPLGHKLAKDSYNCTVCNVKVYNESQGLEYTLSDDETYYIVTEIGNCTDIMVVIPYTYEGLPVKEIGEEAFYEWRHSLEGVIIPNSVTTIGDDAFLSCKLLESIIVSENNASYKLIDGVLYSKDGKELIRYPAGKADASFTIPDSVTTIGRSAFRSCSSLKSVTIGNSVESIGDFAFRSCSSLESVIIPDSVTLIEFGAFDGRTSLESVTIGNGVTSIGSCAFIYCSSLKSVIIGNRVESIGSSAFWYCTSLESVIIPDSVTLIGGGAFHKCSLLESIIIPDSVTSIEYGAFEGHFLLSIYCEAKSRPSGWDPDWNRSNRPVYWYSENEPSTDGNYWHYGTSGEIIIWE